MEFSERIKQLRLDNGYSQTGLAKELFVTRQAISKWERGLGKPDHEVLKQISCFFNISIDDLLKQEDDLIPSANEREQTVESIQLNATNNLPDDPYIAIKNYFQKIKQFSKKPMNFLKTTDQHFFYMGLIALFPGFLYPGFLLFSLPLMFMAFQYGKNKLFYSITVVLSSLLIMVAAYGYMSWQFGWFSNVEVIPLDTEVSEETEQPEAEITEDFSKDSVNLID